MTIALQIGELIDTIGEQQWLVPIARAIQSAVEATFEAAGAVGQQVEDMLHGTMVGHPLHAIVTDIPLGSWSVAGTLDAIEAFTGNRDYAPGADAAVIIGFAGAIAAVASGLTDWKDTGGPARQVGLVHGMLNVVATSLYAWSIFERQRGARSLGRNLAFAGLTLSLTSASLGGDLSYRFKIGVDHANKPTQPNEFKPVLALADLPDDSTRKVDVNGESLLLVRQHGQVYALAEQCSHLGGPLAAGKLEEGGIRCPWHGSCFALADGHVLEGPAVFPQPCLDVQVKDGQVEVRVA